MVRLLAILSFSLFLLQGCGQSENNLRLARQQDSLDKIEEDNRMQMFKKETLLKESKKLENDSLRKELLSSASKKMRVKVDDMNEITWYFDKTSPQFVNYNGFFIYVGLGTDRKPFLKLSIQYAADDWLFIDKYIIKVDEKLYTISENSYGEIKTDNGNGGIWEWLSRDVGESELEIIKAVANGTNVKIRFEGKRYYKDKMITEEQKLALKNILSFYESLISTQS